ncbi:ParA family protein [Planktothrix sp. FACHB-1355]|uniref:ParA family protein n=1 Tax=Aerosakkonema funiforme FACHB-1375 TaxID=2949571 RepID=A0A926ZHK7_9CYAN|nr:MULTISPECIES: ParA family protein [Oscillatoriales]MBD2183383.1 ParA family protein [Aerosakkonema funiforme FACHB-1375]MBD3557477.1 ParA family protein [Planktothrix sp. FACHB-1355]
MLTIAFASLSGGQGKTTAALFLGRRLAALGYSTLMIDADPQHNLTTYLGLELQPNQPTLLECLKKSVAVEDGIYPIEGNDNLFLIPADDQLDTVQDYLSNSGVGATLLLRRLEQIASAFKICVIDSPPQRSQICLTVIGAADALVIPAEASVKGYGSLVRTLDLLQTLQEVKATNAQVLGVLPFRDRWIGNTQTNESRLAVEGMREEVGKELVLPSIRESERYKQAINKRSTLQQMGYADLEYPFEVLLDKIKQLLK